MLSRSALLRVSAAWLVILAIGHTAASAQAPAAPAAASAAPPSNEPAATDAERKAAILGSDCWRRAMFELAEWFRTQKIYSPEEVARLKADFNARVDGMSADELQFVLQDLERKFRILDTPQAREVRAWLGNYLSVLTDRGRENLLRLIPDFETMTSAKLEQTIARLELRRDSRAQQQSQVSQLRNSASNPWAQSAPPAGAPQRSAYRSPYRPQSRERPFENVQVGGRRGMTVSPLGGVWMHFGL